jgi:catechol 2,3-dioxygenase-like lactoylglutathione lyase family enzyme
MLEPRGAAPTAQNRTPAKCGDWQEAGIRFYGRRHAVRRKPVPIDADATGEFAMAPLTPELLVTDIKASLKFWCGLCGFGIAFERLYEGFAYLDLKGAQVMLEERGRSRNWITGKLDSPFGRGINFQIETESVDPILATLAACDWPLFMGPEEKWYRTGRTETGVRQFLVKDPDGYLLRFSQRLGRRTIPPEPLGVGERL